MNRAKGTHRRGGNANGKKYEGRRHGGGRSGRWARTAARVEKAHETVERRAGKAEIVEAVSDLSLSDLDSYEDGPIDGYDY
jgi:hypothetical protein